MSRYLFAFPTGLQKSVIRNDNITTISDGDGNVTRMTYGTNSRVTSIASPTGLNVSLKYDSRGNLTESIDADGLKSTYEYDAKGNPIRQVGPDGQTVEWGYDAFGNPTKMTDSRGNSTNATYDRNGRISFASSQFQLNGETHTLTQSFVYDKEGRTLSSTNSQGNSQYQTYNASGKVASTTDIQGNVTHFTYDEKDRLTRVLLPDNTPNDPTDNPSVSRTYDEADRLTSETSPTGLTTEYVYDDKLNRLVETVLPDLTPNDPSDNPRLKTRYTKAGRLEARTDIFGNWEEFAYNNLGLLDGYTDILGNEIAYTYTKGGQLASTTEVARDRITKFTYDEFARPIETLFFDGSKTTYTYDDLGRIQTETNALGQTTSYEYDRYGEVNAIIDANNERLELKYDHRRNLVKVTDANEHITRYTYDQYSRQTATEYHNGDRVEMSYDRYNRLTQFTDENGNPTTYSYNNLDQLLGIEQANGASTDYTYNNLGRLAEISDPEGNVTKYEYDAFNRLTATVLPLQQRSETIYDSFGRVQSLTDFNGDTINYAYDSLGRLDTKSFSNTNIAPVSYTYDPITSQIRSITDGRGETSYGYDIWDRLNSITQPDGKEIGYSYDVLGNILELTTDAGTVNYTYDALNRLDQVKEAGSVLADYDYDAVGNLIQITRADGTVETRGYDARDRLLEIQTKNSVGRVIAGYNYTLDAVGNRLQVVELDGRTVDYTYDSLHRLTQEKISGGVGGSRTIDYAYDLAGNRLSMADSLSGLTTYSYDANNRLTQMVAGSQTTQFAYDNNGSLLSRSDGTETITYDWINDGENRLVGLNGSENIEYVYDAEGNRVASIVDGVRTNYLVSPGILSQVLAEYDENGQVTKDYVYGIGLVRSGENATESFYHSDGLGSVRMLTDTTGLITDTYTYDAYGVSLSASGTSQNAFQFAGEQRDTTGLDYLRARYYDPELGRFISKDAFPGSLTDPMSQHDYQYAHANPVNNTDPTGYFTLTEAITAISFGGVLASVGSSLGYAGHQYVTGDGISGDEALVMFDQWVAGFGHGVSGGITTAIRREDFGEIQEGDHAFLWNMGNLAGLSVSFMLGFRLPALFAGKLGAAKWAGIFAGGWSAATEAYGVYEAGKGLTDGKWEWGDVFNLLTFVPYAVSGVATISNSIGTLKAANKAAGAVDDAASAAGGIDDVLRSSQKTETAVGDVCFVAGTLVLTPEGEKPIEELQVGEWVVACNPESGSIEKHRIEQVFKRNTNRVLDIQVGDVTITCTPEHPFWIPGQGWLPAGKLKSGYLLLSKDKNTVYIDSIESRECSVAVYNIEVEQLHTYFVSQLWILVHNECFRDFAHGSSLENIQDIMDNGFNSSRAKANSSGGLANRPGSFFAIELPQDGGIQLAYEFALRKNDQPAVVIMKLPEDIFRQLENSGDVLSRPIPGNAEGIIETIFSPNSFDLLNNHAEFPQIIDPYGRI